MRIENYIAIHRKSRMENSQVRDRKIKKVLQPIPIDITKVNTFIYTGAKLVSNKIGIIPKNPNRNTKSGWEMSTRRTNKESVTTRETTEKGKYTGTQRKEKIPKR